jgi:hypothetical protein
VKRWLLVPLVAAAMLAATTPALAGDWHNRDRHRDDRGHSNHDRWDDSDDEDDSDSSDDEDSSSGDDSGDGATAGDAGSGDVPAGTGGVAPVVATGTESSVSAELTGYSWQDNTPPGSATICCEVLHAKAGGTGTYADPITTAVPGSGGSGMEFPAGTKFYIPTLKRYVIVEDSGATKMGLPHLDVWVGGRGHSKSDSDACMNSFTGKATITKNPSAGHPVTVGELTTSNGCKI